jgi:VanZ family protein
MCSAPDAAPMIPRVPRVASLWLPVVAWAALIFLLSSFEAPDVGSGGVDYVVRKVAHVTEYAVLGALLVRATRRELPAFLLGVVYAASDEVHQHFVPGRHATPVDVAIDALGVALGVALYRRVRT